MSADVVLPGARHRSSASGIADAHATTIVLWVLAILGVLALAVGLVRRPG
jgi:hypothetical protein